MVVETVGAMSEEGWPFQSFRLCDQEISAQNIVEVLTPLLTEERLNRIETVVQGRTYNVAPILEHIYDRGNVSAVMRSAEAFGFFNFNIIEPKDGKFKTSQRVAAGSEKWLDVKKHSSSRECVEFLRQKNFQIFATHLEASRPIQEIDFSVPTAIVLGNEKDGVSSEMLDLVDGGVILPMYGFVQSFNISVAGALSFYHIHRERERLLGCSGDLTSEQKIGLKALYMIRSCESHAKVLKAQLGL